MPLDWNNVITWQLHWIFTVHDERSQRPTRAGRCRASGTTYYLIQQGIQAIIAPMIQQGASEEEIKAVVKQARQFYYEQKYVPC